MFRCLNILTNCFERFQHYSIIFMRLFINFNTCTDEIVNLKKRKKRFMKWGNHPSRKDTRYKLYFIVLILQRAIFAFRRLSLLFAQKMCFIEFALAILKRGRMNDFLYHCTSVNLFHFPTNLSNNNNIYLYNKYYTIVLFYFRDC